MSARKAVRRSGPPRVALIVETSLAYGRGLLHGIGRYVRENGPWSVYLEQRSRYDPAPPWLEGWKGDGIISRASSPKMIRTIVGTGLPVVDLNEELLDLGLPLIYNDHQMIGRMAGEHLMERGFTRFAYLGYPAIEWSRRRQGGLAQVVSGRGFHCEVYDGPTGSRPDWSHSRWDEELENVAKWVKQLPKPIGVMACNDYRAVQLMDACRLARVAVPEEVAVVGVDNEDVACELSNPPLTSIVPDAERIGFEAARLLDLMIKRQPLPFQELYVPPRGIVMRASTDVTAIADPLLAAALHFIRQYACEGVGVAEVVAEVGVSRSALQRKFRVSLGRSVLDVITSVRLERVKELLVDSSLSLSDIASRAGFRHSEYLSTVFKQKVGHTISAYRKMNRPGPSADPVRLLRSRRLTPRRSS